MSLATSPTRSHLEYGVRLSDSAFKHDFAALQPGDTVVVEGALGHYILDAPRPAVLVAGGIGITLSKAWPTTPPTGSFRFRSAWFTAIALWRRSCTEKSWRRSCGAIRTSMCSISSRARGPPHG